MYFDHHGEILAYRDAVSHMEIARRVLDSPTSGLGQLGGVWLPLPHLLMLPFIWLNPLYYSGLAGSLVSMASYLATTVLLYKIIVDLTAKRLAALVGALVFMTNPNVLYMQSTPMTEMLLFACVAGMVYLVQRWIDTDREAYLIGAGIVAVLGTLTRYEAWVLLVALTAIIVFAAWRKHYSREKIEGITLAFLFVASVGIVAWLGWNQLIFGNAFYFQYGQYAKPSLWVTKTELAVGHWSIALKTYWYATVDNLGGAVVAVACAGLIALVARHRLKLQTLPALSTLVFFPFFVVALETGQRPLHVSQFRGDALYNVRFGLLMILPASILIGYLVAELQRTRASQAVAALSAVALLLVAAKPLSRASSIATLKEATTAAQTPLSIQLDDTAGFLKRHYSGGRILMESYGNDSLLPQAHIDLTNDVYEGSYQLWQPALAHPEKSGIDWIVMRQTSDPDQVYLHLHGRPALHGYRLVYRNGGYLVYRTAGVVA